MYTLFTAIYPRLEGGGEVIFAQLLDGPLPAASEGVLGQGLASQVVFHLGEIGKSQLEPDLENKVDGRWS